MKRTCSIGSVAEESLTCSSGHAVNSFPRAEIKNIKLTRRGGSALGGAAIGAGAGAILGAASTAGESRNDFLYVSPGAAAAVTAVLGGGIGAAIGAPTDFLRGPTVYQRPKS